MPLRQQIQYLSLVDFPRGKCKLIIAYFYSMIDHYQFTDEVFIERFINLTLKPQYFNHEAHLRLAWIHITKLGIDRAIPLVCGQIKTYATAQGAANKYNETVTVAAVKAVYHFMMKSDTSNFKDFIGDHPRLKTNFKDLLAQHYDIDIFNLEIARSSFLEPNLLPFD